MQRLTSSHELVPSRIERDHVRVVLGLLVECTGQPRDLAHGHPHCKVLLLGVAGAGVRRIGTHLYAALARVL